MTHRHALTDVQWKLLSVVLPRRRGPAPKLNDRLFIDAVLYRLKTGCPWRDLPARFGPWKTVYNTRFDKTATNYLGALHLACAAIWLRELLGDA